MKYLYPISTTTILAAALLISGCGHKENAHTADSLPVAKVSTTLVELRSHPRSQWLPGTVHPADQAAIAARLMATVEEANISIGQEVSAGELLIRLRADEVDAQAEQARAALAQIKRNYEREKSLLEQSATTAETVRTLEDQMRVARARLAEAETMQSYTRIRAPFEGRITSKHVRRGDLASPGTPLLSIEGTGHQRIHVQVPDSLSALDFGSTVTIEADGQPLESTMAEWSPAADPASRTRLVKLDLPEDTRLRSGQYVRVSWPAEETESIWIPAASLSLFGQMERVFVVSGDTLQLVLVRTGARSGDLVQVLSGLEEGEQIVLNPSPNLRDGQPAEIQS